MKSWCQMSLSLIRYRFSLKTSPPLIEKQNSKISQNYEEIRIIFQEFL